MRMILNGAALALLLASSICSVSTPASAYDGHHDSGVVSIGIGGVAFGYRDGYWDNNHSWHRWHNRREYSSYRNAHRSDYRDWNHDRDSNMGWRR